MAYVYQHIRLDTNEVFYIGIGKTKYRVFDKRSRNKYWHHIVNKAGYRIDIIAEGITWEEACQKEKELIEYYGRKDLGLGPLVNMTEGGEGTLGRIMSEMTKQKRYGKKLSEETKQRISNAQKGKKRKLHSEETRKKMSNSKIGKKRPEHSAKLKGKKQSDQTKQKLSDKLKGIPKNKILCPHCGKIGGNSNMIRYHFDNCKVLYN